MNKKLLQLGILLLLVLTLGGCVVIGGHGYGGYGYGFGYGYYDYSYRYDYHGYGYPHIDKDRGWPGYRDRKWHHEWDGHRRSGDEMRPRSY